MKTNYNEAYRIESHLNANGSVVCYNTVEFKNFTRIRVTYDNGSVEYIRINK